MNAGRWKCSTAGSPRRRLPLHRNANPCTHGPARSAPRCGYHLYGVPGDPGAVNAQRDGWALIGDPHGANLPRDPHLAAHWVLKCKNKHEVRADSRVARKPHEAPPHGYKTEDCALRGRGDNRIGERRGIALCERGRCALKGSQEQSEAEHSQDPHEELSNALRMTCVARRVLGNLRSDAGWCQSYTKRRPRHDWSMRMLDDTSATGSPRVSPPGLAAGLLRPEDGVRCLRSRPWKHPDGYQLPRGRGRGTKRLYSRLL